MANHSFNQQNLGDYCKQIINAFPEQEIKDKVYEIINMDLAISQLSITTTTISFLANYFVMSYLICFTSTMKLDYSITTPSTYHSYIILEDDWHCFITVMGTNPILYPSFRDIIILEIK